MSKRSSASVTKIISVPGRFNLEWRVIEEHGFPGSLQMALEEVIAEDVARGAPALVRTFRWDPSTLSMGYGQDHSTVDRSFCATNGIEITRRQTGGGGIYHDHHADISYSIVLPATAVAGDLLTAYHTLCEPLISFFHSIGIDADYADSTYSSIYRPACFLRDIHPAHDLLVDGRKISGNAQYRQHDVVIQHGSILFEGATADHLGVFDSPGVDGATFERRTTTIRDHVDISREQAIEELTDALRDWSGGRVDDWSTDEVDRARALADTKYADDEWLSRV